MNRNANQPTVGFLCGGRAWGGLEMNVLRLANWMKERGWNIILYTCPDSPLCRRAVALQLTVRTIDASRKYRSLPKALYLVYLLKRDKVNTVVLHTNRQVPLAVVTKMLSRNRFKLVYQQHMHIGGSKRDRIHRFLHGRFDLWIAPLEMLAARVCKRTTVPREKVVVIPFGLDFKQFSYEEHDRAAARESLELPAEAMIIGVLGRIDKGKGQDILIKALSHIHGNGHKAHVLILGDPTRGESERFASYLHSLVKQLELIDFVHFRPHQDDIALVYRAIDILALTTYSETYGMVTIEGMAAGLPVVGSNDGGTMEIIQHSRTGMLVRPGDPDDLAKTLLNLIEDSRLRESLGANARKEAVRKYSHDVQCERFERILVSLHEPAEN